MRSASWTSVVGLTFLACSREEAGGRASAAAMDVAPRAALVEYLAARAGVDADPDRSALRWRMLYWADEAPAQNVDLDGGETGGELIIEEGEPIQECEMPVVELGGAWFTDDGELVPGLVLRTATLRPMADGDPAEWDVDPRREVLNPYVELSPPTRAWLRAFLVGSDDDGAGLGPVREFVTAERHRLVRDLCQQHVAWRTHAERARQLIELARRLGLTDGPDVDALRTMVDRFEESAAWEARVVEDLPPIEAAIASEVNSCAFPHVDGEWSHAAFGFFKVEYGWFSPVELRALLRYWDCDVWTRSSRRERDEYTCVTIGERVRSEARALMKADGPVDRQAFARWLDGLGPFEVR